jgi:TolA-binding protein
MNRRHLLVLLTSAAAGCSSQPAEPTSEPTATAPATETETAPATGTAQPTDTATASASPTDTGEGDGGVDAIVSTLNDVYADLEPALDTLEVAALDTDALVRRLETVRASIESQQEAGTVDADRLQSFSDTRWIFDRLVRTFARFDAVYDVHADLAAAYRANDATDRTTTQLAQLKTLAEEAASASGTAILRYDSIDSFDAALDVDYAAFEDHIFRVGDTANALTPLARGLEAAIPARERYQRAVATYDEGAYRDARNAFADLINTFSDARDRFERAERISGPLEPPHERYFCEAGAGRIASVEYRAACREQIDGNPDRADRQRSRAEQRYTSCSATTPSGTTPTATPSG